MRTAKYLISAFVLIGGVTMLLAGLAHEGKKTYLTSSPAPVSLWRRDNTLNEAYPVNASYGIKVWDNSIQIMINSNSTTRYDCGLWELDSNSDFMPIDADTGMYSRRGDPGAIVDAEWELDSNGDLMLKAGLF